MAARKQFVMIWVPLLACPAAAPFGQPAVNELRKEKSMKIGMNLLMWTDTLSDEMLPLLDQMKEIGFDAVEIPCFDLENIDNYAKWGKRFDELGLARTGTAVRGPDQNQISPDPAVRRAGIDANKRNLDCCAAAGCRVMAGPFHSALGEFSGKGPTDDEWQ